MSPRLRLSLAALVARWRSSRLARGATPTTRWRGARLLYNQRQFEAAVSAAEQARLMPARADAADLVAARAYLERFRDSAASDDLTNARDRLRRIDPQRFAPRERAEYIVGLGEALFFDGAYGAAAAVFDSVLRSRDALPRDARERVLDWWASALDRDAKPRPEIDRQAIYQRIRDADATTSSRRIPAARRRRTGWRRPRAARAICRRRGMRRRPAGCARRCGRPRRRAARRSRSAGLRAIVPERAKVDRRSRPRSAAREWEQFKDSAGKTTDLDDLMIWCTSRVSADLFASFQFSPMPTSTVSGTFSAAADCIRSRTSAANSSARVLRHLEQQLVVDGEDHPRLGVRRERGVDVDHRALHDVGGACPESAC